MPIQRTFELIPTSFAKPTSHKPPMTSKQVKRAYQKANQEKKISHSEQRRLLAEELARQRKEYNRVKSFEKARVIKERKLAKVTAELERRKKAGLPNPSRLVRASQKLIAPFVKDTHYRKKCEEEIRISIKNKEEKNSPTINKSCSDQDPDNDNHVDNVNDQMDIQSLSKLNHSPLEPVAMLVDSEDEYGDFPFCTQLETIATSIACDKMNQVSLRQEDKIDSKTTVSFVGLHPNEMDTRDSENVGGLSLHFKHEEYPESNLKASLNEPKASFSLHKFRSLAEDCKKKSPAEIFATNEEPWTNKTFNIPQSSCFNYQKSHEGSPAKIFVEESDLTIPSATMPAEEKDQLDSTDIKLHETKSLGRVCKFFPDSPTQEICEIIDDLDADDFPSNSQILNEINPSGSPHFLRKSSPLPQKLEHHCLLEHSDLMIGNQSRSSLNIATKTCPHQRDSWNMNLEQIDDLDDLICTQDLVNMSQEIREMTNPLQSLEAEINMLKPKEKTRERKRFFEEKEEDLLEAALYESRMINNVNTNTTKNDKLVSIENFSKSRSLPAITTKNTSYQRSIELSIQKKQLSPATPGEQSQNLAGQRGSSLSSSSLLWENLESHFYSSPSSGTDYGMDEFSCDDWDELSAL